MRITTAFFLFLTTLPVGASEGEADVVGTVIKYSDNLIELDEMGATHQLGFVADPDALASLMKIKIGEEVLVVMGATPGPDGFPINKLISIRACGRIDAECAASLKREEENRWYGSLNYRPGRLAEELAPGKFRVVYYSRAWSSDASARRKFAKFAKSLCPSGYNSEGISETQTVGTTHDPPVVGLGFQGILVCKSASNI